MWITRIDPVRDSLIHNFRGVKPRDLTIFTVIIVVDKFTSNGVDRVTGVEYNGT